MNHIVDWTNIMFKDRPRHYHILKSEEKASSSSDTGRQASSLRKIPQLLQLPRPYVRHSSLLTAGGRAASLAQDGHSRSAPAFNVSISQLEKNLRRMRLPSTDLFPVGVAVQSKPSSSDNTSSVQPDFMSSERLIKIRDDLRFSLINKYGPSRARTLYEKHVKRCHYLLINAEEDDEMAAVIRKLLEDCLGSPTIKGRWNVVIGSQRLDVWQQLIQSATTILVFLSRALCKDEILSLTFPSVLTQDRLIVPLYLEEFTPQEVEREFLSNLRPVMYSYGTTLYDRSIERIKEYVDNLHSKFNYVKHYCEEVKALQDLLMPTDLLNICPCGEC